MQSSTLAHRRLSHARTRTRACFARPFRRVDYCGLLQLLAGCCFVGASHAGRRTPRARQMRLIAAYCGCCCFSVTSCGSCGVRGFGVRGCSARGARDKGARACATDADCSGSFCGLLRLIATYCDLLRLIAAAAASRFPRTIRVVRIANRANREAPKSGDSRRIARRSIKSRIARIVI